MSTPGQSSPANFSRLAAIPAVCRNGNLNRTLIDRQNRIAASEKTDGRPGSLSCGASQAISLSTHISREPRLHNAALAIGLEPMAPQWLDSWTSSSCDIGRVRALSSDPSKIMDSQSESLTLRVVQQRLSEAWIRPFCAQRDEQRLIGQAHADAGFHQIPAPRVFARTAQAAVVAFRPVHQPSAVTRLIPAPARLSPR